MASKEIGLIVDGFKGLLITAGGLVFIAPSIVEPFLSIGVAGVTLKLLSGLIIFVVGLLSLYEVVRKY